MLSLAFNLTFKSKDFPVILKMQVLQNTPEKTLFDFISKKSHEIQANVDDDVFDSFYNYLAHDIVPDIQINNVNQYIEINKEFCIQSLNDIIDSKKKEWGSELTNIALLKNNTEIDESKIEEEIAVDLDNYIDKYCEELLYLKINYLYNIFFHKNRKLTKFNNLYEKIKIHYEKTNDSNIFILLPSIDWEKLNPQNQQECINLQHSRANFLPSIPISSLQNKLSKLEEIKKRYFRLLNNSVDEELALINSCTYDDLDLAFKTKEKEIKEKGITYELDDATMTARIIMVDKSDNKITIPCNISFDNKEYIIKKIDMSAFNGQNIRIIDFPENSDLETIENKLFSFKKNKFFDFRRTEFGNDISKIIIPSSVKELKPGWIFLSELQEIQISPDNKNYKYVDNKYIVGKSNDNMENFDVLIFARRDIKEITIPSTIKRIDPYCFSKCIQLRKVEFLPDSQLESIECCAFANTHIEHIKIPEKVKIIEYEAFYECYSLIKVEFSPNSQLETIGNSAFKDSSIENIIIPRNTKYIRSDAFANCSQLIKVEFSPDSQLETIGNSAFKDTSIENIIIPRNTKYIRSDAFANCSQLIKVEFSPDSKLEIIEYHSFSSSITSIKIPATIKELEPGCFYQCHNLVNIKISPDNKNYKYVDNKYIVGKSSNNKDNFDVLYYARCDIEEITIPSTIERIDPYCFSSCLHICKVEFSPDSQLETIGDYSFSSSSIEHIEIPHGVKTIGSHAFENCLNLTKIEFSPDSQLETIGDYSFIKSSIEHMIVPPQVKIIGSNAFQDCSKLTKIEFSPDSQLETIGDYSFKKSSIEHMIVPPQVKIIGSNAFQDCSKLTKIEFSPDSQLETIGESSFRNSSIERIYIPCFVKCIESSLFESCEKLIEIEFPSNSQIREIKFNAFSRSSIKSIKIPSNTIKISSYAFRGCSNLFEIDLSNSKIQFFEIRETKVEKITIPSRVKKIKLDFNSMFNYDYNYLKDIQISPDNKNYKYIDNKFIVGKSNDNIENFDVLFFARRDIKEITIPSTIKRIDPYCFSKCIHLQKVEFSPNSQLQSIGEFAFSGTSISKIIIPPGVKSIERSAFEDCYKLSKVDFSPDSQLKNIGSYSFTNSSIEHIIIPSHVKFIGSESFSKCKKLTKVDFSPNSEINKIDSYAFSNSSIESIIIPPSIISIESSLFNGCDKLKKILISFPFQRALFDEKDSSKIILNELSQ